MADEPRIDVFIGYAREDEQFVSSLVRALESRPDKWNVWWDRKVSQGADYRKEIEEAFGKAHCVVIVWSQYSIRSHWVRDEADDARDSGRLVQLVVDGAMIPRGFRQIQLTRLPRIGDPGLSETEEALYEGISRKVQGESSSDEVDHRVNRDSRRPAALSRAMSPTLSGAAFMITVLAVANMVQRDDLSAALALAAIASPAVFGIWLGLRAPGVRMAFYLTAAAFIALCGVVTVVATYIDEASPIPWTTLAVFLVFGVITLFATGALTGRLFRRRADGSRNARVSAERYAVLILSRMADEWTPAELNVVAGLVRLAGPFIGFGTAATLLYFAFQSISSE